jgi:hypothetical protein
LRQRVWGAAVLSGSFGKFGAGDEGTFFGFFDFFGSLRWWKRRGARDERRGVRGGFEI